MPNTQLGSADAPQLGNAAVVKLIEACQILTLKDCSFQILAGLQNRLEPEGGWMSAMPTWIGINTTRGLQPWGPRIFAKKENRSRNKWDCTGLCNHVVQQALTFFHAKLGLPAVVTGNLTNTYYQHTYPMHITNTHAQYIYSIHTPIHITNTHTQYIPPIHITNTYAQYIYSIHN